MNHSKATNSGSEPIIISNGNQNQATIISQTTTSNATTTPKKPSAAMETKAAEDDSSLSSLVLQRRTQKPKAVPVAVSLRNLFIPCATATAATKSKVGFHKDQRRREPCLPKMQSSSSSTTTVFHRNPMRRIQMDIVAPYSLFMQLKILCWSCPIFQKRMTHWMSETKTRAKITTSANASANLDVDDEDGLVRLFSASSGHTISLHSHSHSHSHSFVKTRNDFREEKIVVGLPSGQMKEYRLPFLCKELVGTDSHPLWDHICDCMDDLYEYLIGHHHGCLCRCNGESNMKDDEKRDMMDDIWNKILASTMIQCYAILDTNNDYPRHNHEGGDDVVNIMNHDHDDTNRILLALSPLNDSDMIPLPLVSTDHSNHNMLNSSTILGISKYANAIPHSLPLNSILVHYSDGTTRVSPGLYEILVENGVIPEDALHGKIGLSMSTMWGKYEKRFEDDMFEVLQDDACHDDSNGGGDNDDDGSALRMAATKTNGDINLDSMVGSSSSSSSSVVSSEPRKIEKESFEVKRNKAPYIKMKWNENGTDLVMKGHASLSFSTPGKKSNEKTVIRGSFAEAFQSLSADRRVSNRLTINDSDPIPASVELGDVSNHVGDGIEDRADKGDCVVGENDSGVIRRIEQLEEEIQQLEEILILEENALKKQQEKQKQDVSRLKEFIVMIERIDDERKQIEKEAMDTENNCILEENLIRMKRRKLLQDLEKIYPIQTGDVFTICGIPIPKDMHSLSASDEIISAGLGFVCLVVIMCSKYLSVPLRYRLIFNSSRSAVREEFEVYPLFKERVVEREQFDRGIILLSRNIEHLLEMQGVIVTKNRTSMHILSKVDLLLRHIDH